MTWPDGTTEPKRLWFCSKCGAECDPDLHWGCDHGKTGAAELVEVPVVPAPRDGQPR